MLLWTIVHCSYVLIDFICLVDLYRSFFVLLFVNQLALQSGKACLGEIMYRYIAAEQFTPEYLFDCLDLSSEHHTLEVVNMIEASVHVWKQKGQRKHKNNLRAKCSSWGGKVKGLAADGDKNQFLAQRAETLLHSLRLRFPVLPQTALDMSKLQYNKVFWLNSSLQSWWTRVLDN